MEEYSKKPCPFKITEDTGGAFALGCIAGGLFQGISGFRNAPTGFKRRLVGSLSAIKTRSPITGGNFAIWGGMFSTIDCSLIYFRKKEDPWNSIISGAATSGILAARKGVLAVASNAIIGGVLLGLIEVVTIINTRMSAEHFRNPAPPTEDPAAFRDRNKM